MTSDLFSITCTTCKSRLKVREESAIGQILACPKCGGMVMVRPPEGWQKGQPLPVPPPEQPAGITTTVNLRRGPEETLGDSQFDDIDDLLSDAPPRPKPSSVSVAADAPGLARPRFVGAPPPAASASPPHLPAAAHAAAHAAQTTSESPHSAAAASQNLASAFAGAGPAVKGRAAAASQPSPALLPSAAGAATAEGPKPPPPAEADTLPVATALTAPNPLRYGLMMAGSVAAGIALALAVVVGMIWLFKGDPQTIAQAAPNTNSALAPTTVAATTPSAGTPAQIDPSEATPSVEPVATSPEMPAVESQPSVEEPAETTEPMPPPASEEDPLGLTKPPQPPVVPANPIDPLAKFDQLIGDDNADPLAKPDEAIEPAPTATPPAEPDPAAATPARPILPRPLPRDIDVSARLADPLQGIETSGTPLADFLQVISELSTIPITLQTAGLPLVGVTPESPVVLKSTNTTVGGALTLALAPLKLEHIQADGHLLVRVAEPTELPTLGFPAKDLTDGDETQMVELAEALQTLIAPEAWNAASGGGSMTPNVAKGTLDIRQSRAIHAQLLVAFEKLRTARKLPYATGARYDASLFGLASRSARAKPRLDLPVSLTFAQPTPFVRILKHLEETAKLRILVDWQALAAAGWNADGEATLVADKQPLAAALDTLLEPMDLAWRVVDSRTLQITTPERLANDLELEFYKVETLTADDPTGMALVAKLQAALGDSLFREAGGQCELRYDEPGQCLLASLPQMKQREVERLLEKMRDEAAK